VKRRSHLCFIKLSLLNHFCFDYVVGEIGDWKNWFTCADNEMFDETWTKEMAKSKLFEFKYTCPRS
jgi:hypothetical protein